MCLYLFLESFLPGIFVILETEKVVIENEMGSVYCGLVLIF